MTLEWEIVDHACRHCMGRLVVRQNEEGQSFTRCCECGAEVLGGHDALCWCGVEVRGESHVFECFRNLRQNMEVPQEILVRERRVVRVPERPEPRRLNPVALPGST